MWVEDPLTGKGELVMVEAENEKNFELVEIIIQDVMVINVGRKEDKTVVDFLQISLTDKNLINTMTIKNWVFARPWICLSASLEANFETISILFIDDSKKFYILRFSSIHNSQTSF